MADDNEQPLSVVDKLTIEYATSPLFRMVHYDGAYGGATPRGHIQALVFNERPAIPLLVQVDVRSDGSLGREQRLDHQDRGLLREFEVGLVFSRASAREFAAWLNSRVDQMDAVDRELAQQEEKA